MMEVKRMSRAHERLSEENWMEEIIGDGKLPRICVGVRLDEVGLEYWRRIAKYNGLKTTES